MMFLKPGAYLKPLQLERLKEHKYKSEGTSMFEPVLQVYWRWLVTKVPLWLAPNLITFIGLLINVFTTLPIMLLDSNATGIAPWWCYLTCAMGFFIYQSLDAIDGKQARRTNTNTPLGELFDHGCDAISGFTVVMSALSAVGIQEFPRLGLGYALLLMVLSYCYHWQTYVSGVLHFKWFDVTEAQFLHMVMLVAAAIFGQSIYMFQIPFVDIPFKMVVIVIAYSLSILNGIIALHIVLTSGVGKNGSTVADTSVLSPLLLPLLQVPVALLYVTYSITPLHHYCMLFITAMVFPLVKSIIHIIVASMTKSPLPLFDTILLGPLLAFANVYFGGVLPEKYVLIAVVMYNMVDIIAMCVGLCHQICKYLEIPLFTIPHPPSPTKKPKELSQQ